MTPGDLSAFFEAVQLGMSVIVYSSYCEGQSVPFSDAGGEDRAVHYARIGGGSLGHLAVLVLYHSNKCHCEIITTVRLLAMVSSSCRVRAQALSATDSVRLPAISKSCSVTPFATCPMALRNPPPPLPLPLNYQYTLPLHTLTSTSPRRERPVGGGSGHTYQIR